MRIGVPAGVPVWTDISTVSGRIRSDAEGAGQPAEGQHHIEVRAKTVSGDIVLTRDLSTTVNRRVTTRDATAVRPTVGAHSQTDHRARHGHEQHADRDPGPAPDRRARGPRLGTPDAGDHPSRTASPSAFASRTASTTEMSGTHRDTPPPVAHEGDLAAVHAQLADQVPTQRRDHPDSPAIQA